MSEDKNPVDQDGASEDQGRSAVDDTAVVSLLSPAHMDELHSSAITDDVIDECGAYTAYATGDLPAWGQWIGRKPGTLPALVYPMVEVDGTETGQIKPQTGSLTMKYVSPSKDSGTPSPSLVVIRPITDDTETIVIVEGVKQALAVASYAPVTWAIFCICGIYGWSGEAGPTPYLDVVVGKKVVIIPDADAASNRMVYDGAVALGDAASAAGAASVAFARVPGAGKAGVDDALASRKPDKRAGVLRRWVAQSTKKPANKRPAAKEQPTPLPTDRPQVYLDGDPAAVLDNLGKALREAYAGSQLFRQAGGFTELVEIDGSMQSLTVDVPRLTGLVVRACVPVMPDARDYPIPTTPRRDIVSTLATEWMSYPELRGISTVPVVRADGSIFTDTGYDPETRMWIQLSADLQDLVVPEAPTDDDVAAARYLLEVELLGDFPWVTPGDRARAIASILTPLIRPIVPTAPMMLYNATQPGSGKGLLADIGALITAGERAEVQPAPEEDSELRKMLTARLIAGQTQIFLDERSEWSSKVLNAFLTAARWTDRILGVSTTASVQNLATVYTAGNGVSVSGDTSRRVLRADLAFEGENPEARSDFRHPDLRGWVRENRRQLLTALLTLVRAWYSRGCPRAVSMSRPMGSFEQWHEIVAGVLEVAGIDDLMAGVSEQRATTNFEAQAWEAHWEWVRGRIDQGQLNASGFTARQVGVELLKDRANAEAPYEMDDLLDKENSRRLGKAYAREAGRPRGGYVLRAVGERHKVKLWMLRYPGTGGNTDGGNGDGGGPSGGPTSPSPTDPTKTVPSHFQHPSLSLLVEDTDADVKREALDSSGDVTVVTFDLETGDAATAATTADPRFIRLAAWSVNGGDPEVSTDVDRLCQLLSRADIVVGHNVLAYDLPLLHRLYGLDIDTLINRNAVRDTLLLARLCDPVPSGSEGNRLKYDLDSVAQRLGVTGKLVSNGATALSSLAETHGGYDKIPVDDPQYRAYAAQDVRATWAVFMGLACDEYALREHQIVRRVTAGVAHGIRVDGAAVDALLEDERQVHQKVVEWLHEVVGVPLTDAQGHPSKAPWSTAAGMSAIAAYMESVGVEPPVTDRGAMSLGKDKLAALAEKHPDNTALHKLVDQLVTVRQTSPAATVQKYIHPDSRLYPSIQPRQATGRWSMTNPGMTTFGSRSDRLLAQRAMIVPDSPHEVLISVDLSQIDARAMAAGAQDPNYAELFTSGRDSHTEMAVRVFGDASRRSDAKALAHAANYGMGAHSFSKSAGVSEGEAEGMLTALRLEFPELERFKDQLRTEAKTYGYITTAFGRRVRVDRNHAWTQAPAAYGQGTARDVLMDAILRMPRNVSDRIRIYVHDEVVLSVPRERAQEYRDTVLDAMTSVIIPTEGDIAVPILADAGVPGDTWAGCYADE